jgi:hypothetical protein
VKERWVDAHRQLGKPSERRRRPRDREG